MIVKFLGYCRRPYKGCSPLRLRRGAALAALLTFAVAGGGCSMSYQLESYFGDNTTTGSISPAPGAKNAEKLPPQHDLAYAKAAASEVLRRGEKDASLDWENPSTGARGTVTPMGPDHVSITNGPAVNREGTRIYFTDTLGQKILVGELGPGGALGEVRLFADTKAHFPNAYPDGPVFYA